ncbi:DUF3325 domain-containing protein [Dechloromonas denitrificans]|jgi:hypothetical protein|uniref:DUF3325 domain-containing protein n=1 Tax=Dechloromonas denitrificans TaxID=281362 RepID=UPI001CF85C55|nr:DUF3325 domain-containing protein [Dechloromonas denitrificans]UCV12785.1 DUF3325 domain-containing protein [Dechloromonas denitrificans]
MTLLFVLALLMIVAGMAGLALGMTRHFQAVFRHLPAAGVLHWWRGIGVGLLGLALLPCVAGWGVAIGIVLWSGLLAAGVIAVALYLAKGAE